MLIASGLISALVLVVSGGAWALTGYVNGNVGRVNAGTAGTPPSGPLNILLAGVDRRSGLTPAQEAELHVGHVVSLNSDTMMLIHLSADHTGVTVVSFPRDSWVDIPGHGMNKINAAYGLGGPRLMVQTVEQATGLTINDYIEVNFLGFVRVIDALGGVDICLPQALSDSYSGLNLPAGKQHVDGITALKYARDRHSFATEDLARIDNQQRLLASLLNEAISGGTLANPLRLSRFLSATLAAVKVDSSLNVAALADQMRGISASKVAFTTVPVADANYTTPDGQSAVQWDTAAADRLFSAISSDKPLVTPPPKTKAKPKPGAGGRLQRHPDRWPVRVHGCPAHTARLPRAGRPDVAAAGRWPDDHLLPARSARRRAPGPRCPSRRVTQKAVRTASDQGSARCERLRDRRAVVRKPQRAPARSRRRRPLRTRAAETLKRWLRAARASR